MFEAVEPNENPPAVLLALFVLVVCAIAGFEPKLNGVVVLLLLPLPPPPNTDVVPGAAVLLSAPAPNIDALLLLLLAPNTEVVADLFSPIDPNVGGSVLFEFEPNIDVAFDKLLLVLPNIGAATAVVDAGFGDPKPKTLLSDCFTAADLLVSTEGEL